MVPLRPKTHYEHRHHAPKYAPCPHGGTPGTRKQKFLRTVRALAYQAILRIRVTTAEYRARGGCGVTFRTQVEDVEPKAQYTNSVREAVLDRLRDDHRSRERLQAARQRDFLLDLSTGFLYDCLRGKARPLDRAAYRHGTLQAFSGTRWIDEIHLGKLTLRLATDPCKDFPVAFARVSRNDQEHRARFLRQRRDQGFHPRGVVTDGSSLYPAVLAAGWPAAEHPLCIFPVLQDLNRRVRDAVCRLRKALTRRAGQGRGRRGRWPQAPADRPRRRRELKQKATLVFRHRYLLVRRRESLGERERQDRITRLEYRPSVRGLRPFVDRLHPRFEHAQTIEQAWQRFANRHAEATFATVPELAKALTGLTAEKFTKRGAFLRSPGGHGCGRRTTGNGGTGNGGTRRKCVTGGGRRRRSCGWWSWRWRGGGGRGRRRGGRRCLARGERPQGQARWCRCGRKPRGKSRPRKRPTRPETAINCRDQRGVSGFFAFALDKEGRVARMRTPPFGVRNRCGVATRSPPARGLSAVSCRVELNRSAVEIIPAGSVQRWSVAFLLSTLPGLCPVL